MIRSNEGSDRLLIVGNPHPIHVGAHLYQAAQELSLDVRMLDSNLAFAAPAVVRIWNWRMRGHRPPRLKSFGRLSAATCSEFQPKWVLATGMAPLSASALSQLKETSATVINYLTDDPWNPVHRAPWFLAALPYYDVIFNTRQSNISELQHAGCKHVEYMPFAFNPAIHFAPGKGVTEIVTGCESDILFAGGADPDRIHWIAPLIDAGFKLALYGGYWERFSATSTITRGHADMATIRQAVAGTKIALVLVRRANRDGHVMRSFEVAAMGACLLVEDTAEHRAIFGAEGESVLYFLSVAEMLSKSRWLLDHSTDRERLALAVHRRILNGGHTYSDRLSAMLEFATVGAS